MSTKAVVRVCAALAFGAGALQASAQFQLQEATFDSMHAAIKSGEITCKQVIEGYLARARAYDGICSVPVTESGGKLPKVTGATRAGVPLAFPTQSVALRSRVPDFDQYTGYKPDYG